MRKYFIDNLRILCIIMLFPYHTAMIYNNLGGTWFLQGVPNRIASLFIISVYPWWMSLLFVLAGMSTVYALEHRTPSQYRMERCKKLLIPFVAGLLMVVPIQTYIADYVNNGYRGSYFAHYKEFFIITDFNGGDGHLTPAHLWFMLFLLVISIVAQPIISFVQKKWKHDFSEMKVFTYILLFLLPACTKAILNISGKSIGEYLAFFLLGALFLCKEEVQNKLQCNWVQVTVAWVILMIIRITAFQILFPQTITSNIEQYFTANPLFLIIYNLEESFFAWIGILALIGIGKRFLDCNNRFTLYFSQATFPIYIFHQSIIVATGFFLMPLVGSPIWQYILIVLISFIVSLGFYEIAKRVKLFRFLFGIK